METMLILERNMMSIIESSNLLSQKIENANQISKDSFH
jgi:hypothetical protein